MEVSCDQHKNRLRLLALIFHPWSQCYNIGIEDKHYKLACFKDPSVVGNYSEDKSLPRFIKEFIVFTGYFETFCDWFQNIWILFITENYFFATSYSSSLDSFRELKVWSFGQTRILREKFWKILIYQMNQDWKAKLSMLREYVEAIDNFG